MDRGTWQATSPWGCEEYDTTERLTHTHGLKMIWKIKEIPGKTQGEKECYIEGKEYKRYSK